MIRFTILPIVLAVLISSIGTAASSSTTTRVFLGATVLTVDDSFSVVEAIAISGNKILAVGSESEVLEVAGSSADVTEVSGKTIMPAFIDAHLHTIAATKFSLFEDVGLTRFNSVEDALDHMIARGKKAQKGDWLLFTNIDFGTQASNTDKLTAKMLDLVSSDNPVFVFHAGGHVSSANSKMLEHMGVNRDTPDPEAGGSFGRQPDGSPNGMLYGFASLVAMQKLDPFNNFDLDIGITTKSKEWVSSGLGTVGDAGIGATGDPKELALLRQFATEGKMQFRVRGYLSYGLETQWNEQGVEVDHGDQKVRVVGYKLSADGSNQARTGLQREPYPGTDSKGIHYLDEAEIYAQIMDKSARGFQLAIHGNGDAAIDNIISAVERAGKDGAELVRPRIEHCSIVQDDQLARLKQLDISCSFLIGHVRLWGSAFKDRVFGLEKSEKLDRTGSFERLGIPYSLHTDNTVTTFTPLEMVEIAVTRKLFSEPDFVLAPDERASVEMALRGVTSVAAWQLMSDHEIGSLEAGKLADFVILESDPRKVEQDRIGEIKVLQTWIDGNRVH